MIEVASELGIVNDLQRAKNCYTREETEQLLVHLKEVQWSQVEVQWSQVEYNGHK